MSQIISSLRVVVFAGAALWGTIGLASEQPKARIITDPAYTHAQRLVEVAPHRRLNLYCEGSGSPTVVFDSGLSDDISVWGFVQPVIAEKTRTCSYDRAGIGFSDPSGRSGSSLNIADDLNALLRAADIKPPYILVGHSYGGLNMTVFARLHPNEVAGMVLVDPVYENQVDDARKIIPDFDQTMLVPNLEQRRRCVAEAKKGFVPGTELYKICVDKDDPALSSAINAVHHNQHLQPAYQQADLSEKESVRGGLSEEQEKAVRGNFGNMPLIVLTRPLGTGPLGNHETPQTRAAFYSAWMAGHDALAARSKRGTNRVVPNTDHYIQIDQPDAVNEAILEVLKSASD